MLLPPAGLRQAGGHKTSNSQDPRQWHSPLNDGQDLQDLALVPINIELGWTCCQISKTHSLTMAGLLVLIGAALSYGFDGIPVANNIHPEDLRIIRPALDCQNGTGEL